MGTRLQKLQQLMLLGHCADSRAAVHNSRDKTSKLMEVYFYYIRECTKKDFPALDFLREQFGKLVEPYGGYIDKAGELAPLKKMVFLGSCKSQFTTSSYNIHQCWVRHESQVEIRMDDHSHVHLDCFEGSNVVLHILSPYSMAVVHQYGNSKVTISGHAECVKVTHHSTPTYVNNNQ